MININNTRVYKYVILSKAGILSLWINNLFSLQEQPLQENKYAFKEA